MSYRVPSKLGSGNSIMALLSSQTGERQRIYAVHVCTYACMDGCLCCFNQLDLENFSCFIERKKALPSVLLVHWSHDVLFLCIPHPSPGDWWEISAADAAHWCAYWPLYSPGTGPQDLRASHQGPPAVPLRRRRGRLLHGLRRTGQASEGEGENRDSVNATVSAISAFLCLWKQDKVVGKGKGLDHIWWEERQKWWPSFCGIPIPVIWWSKRLGSVG